MFERMRHWLSPLQSAAAASLSPANSSRLNPAYRGWDWPLDALVVRSIAEYVTGRAEGV